MTNRLAAAGLAALSLAGCETVKQVSHVGSACHNAQATLYFDTGSDILTDAGRQIVELTAKRLKKCEVTELRLVGLTDPKGSVSANVELSQRRANNVLDAFVHAGVPAPKYTLVAAGAKGAVAEGGAIEPVHRRVDVTVVVK